MHRPRMRSDVFGRQTSQIGERRASRHRSQEIEDVGPTEHRMHDEEFVRSRQVKELVAHDPQDFSTLCNFAFAGPVFRSSHVGQECLTQYRFLLREAAAKSPLKLIRRRASTEIRPLGVSVERSVASAPGNSGDGGALEPLES